MTELKTTASVAILAWFGSLTTTASMVVQQPTILDNSTLLPVGMVVGLFAAAMTAVVKVVRLIDGIQHRLERIEEKLEIK